MPIRPEDAAVALRLSADRGRALWLCFEPWGNEYTLEPGTHAVVCFPTTAIEMTHIEGGIVFFTMGVHPDVWGVNGEELLIWSDDMPPTPDTPNAEAIARFTISSVPPAGLHRSHPERHRNESRANEPNAVRLAGLFVPMFVKPRNSFNYTQPPRLGSRSA